MQRRVKRLAKWAALLALVAAVIAGIHMAGDDGKSERDSAPVAWRTADAASLTETMLMAWQGGTPCFPDRRK